MAGKSSTHGINYVIIDISVQISTDRVSYRIHQNGEIASLMKAFCCRAIQVYKYLLCLYKYKKVPEFLVLGKQFLQGPVYSHPKQNLLGFE